MPRDEQSEDQDDWKDESEGGRVGVDDDEDNNGNGDDDEGDDGDAFTMICRRLICQCV